MLLDIYGRDPSDSRFDPDALDTGDPEQSLIAKIYMLIGTQKGEVLGEPGMGLSLIDLLYTMDFNEKALEKAAGEQIYAYIPEAYEHDIRVRAYFFRGTQRDGALLDIVLNGRSVMGVLVK